MSEHQDADVELLSRYAQTAGRAELAALVARYLDLVYSAARRQLGGNADRAQDVTQQVFIVLMRKAPTLRPGTVLASWLLKVTAYECRNVLRAESRRTRREREVAAMTPETGTSSSSSFSSVD